MANAKVEVAVQVAQRWNLARLRNHRFFSLPELNVTIRRLLDELNRRVTRGYGASRANLFATLDRPIRSLCRLNPMSLPVGSAPGLCQAITYSVPFALIKQEVDVRFCGQTVKIFHHGQLVVSHVRTPGRRSHVTVADYMPPAHRHFAE